jgi:hypothetical protein
MKRWCLLAAILALPGCGGGGKKVVEQGPAAEPATGAAPWPAPKDPMALASKAGLTPETHETLVFHVHAHLDVFVNGKRAVVPAGIGIAIDDPAVKQFEGPNGSVGYGGISPPCSEVCISPLHTHFIDGVLHTESLQHKYNSLGEFFTEWDVALSSKCVGGYCKPVAPFTIYVDGDPYTGDPRQIELKKGREIAVVIGTPPAEIPSAFPSG